VNSSEWWRRHSCPNSARSASPSQDPTLCPLGCHGSGSRSPDPCRVLLHLIAPCTSPICTSLFPTSLNHAPRELSRRPLTSLPFQDCTTVHSLTSHPKDSDSKTPDSRLFSDNSPPTRARTSPDTLSTQPHPCAFPKSPTASHPHQSSVMQAVSLHGSCRPPPASKTFGLGPLTVPPFHKGAHAPASHSIPSARAAHSRSVPSTSHSAAKSSFARPCGSGCCAEEGVASARPRMKQGESPHTRTTTPHSKSSPSAEGYGLGHKLG